MEPVAETLYMYEKPFVVDHGKFEQVYGTTVTSHQEAVQQTEAWYRENPLPG